MENVIMSRPREELIGFDAKKFLIMRTLARFHECDEEALLRSIDSTGLEIHDILKEMISEHEVEVSPPQKSRGKRKATFALTLNGWGEYMKALGSIYELPE
jgi:hypothetical protein